MVVQVRLLGPLEVVGANGPASLGGAKERAVFAMLALHVNQVVSEDRMVDALWKDSPPRTATKTFRSYVSRLRRAVAEAGADKAEIETVPGGYRLLLEPDELDVARVEQLLDEARAAVAQGDPTWAAVVLAEAARTWRGQPLGDLADEHWAIADANRLAELRLVILEERVDAELACGRHSSLVAELESLCTTYPLRERFWAQHIVALYRSGRQAEALRVYQRLRGTLADELGLEPSPELQALERAVLAQDPTLAWQPSGGTAPSPLPARAVELPTGVVTIFCTDIEASTRLWEGHPTAMARALARHDHLVAEVVGAAGGRVIKSKGEGDSTLSVFFRASDAVAAALRLQLALLAEEWPELLPLRVRMALHTGEAEQRDGDYFGLSVNRAARLRSLAAGGEIFCSRATAELVIDDPPEGAELVEIGRFELKDLTRAEHVYAVVHPELPALTTKPAIVSPPRTNLPAPTSSFVGRAQQLAHVASVLQQARVTTLTGVGGVGKTRLALESAARALAEYQDGVWLVEFASIADPSAVVEVVAGALHVVQRQGQSLHAHVMDFLRAKSLLLILDNCEHLLEPVARFIDDVVRACPRVVVLATSREGLGVQGEHIIAVPSLQLPAPDTPETIGASEAVRLFVERAEAAKDSFALTLENEDAVVQLCRRLDGIPLAIELAAARVRSLTPAELAERVDKLFELLTAGPRTAVERHQTLRRAIDWSYDLLEGQDRSALNRLAVFAGGFDVAAAEAVVSGERVDVGDVGDLLGRLVDKSLVIADDTEGTTRFRLLETIRQYAEERLADEGQVDLARRRHAEHYAAFSSQARAGLRGPDEVIWIARVGAELDNLRAALTWAAATHEIDLAVRLVAPLMINATPVGYAIDAWPAVILNLPESRDHPFRVSLMAWTAWSALMRGDIEGGLSEARAALDALDAEDLAPEARCLVLCCVTSVFSLAAHGEAIAVSQRWVEEARHLADDFELAEALTGLAISHYMAGSESSFALLPCDEALGYARHVGSPTVLGMAAMVGALLRVDSEPDAALALAADAINAATLVDNHLTAGIAAQQSSWIHLAQGDWREAAWLGLRSLEHLQHVGDTFFLREFLADACIIFATGGVDEPAAVLAGACRLHTRSESFKSRFNDAGLLLRQRLGDKSFDDCQARGAAMDEYELVDMVRHHVGTLS
jgi:predicted ATPase/DNA-binding SARP family transcriptional activator/class 3 adenylate cyclase